jgi:hypothetical protein
MVWLNGLFPYINDDFFYQYIVMYNLDRPIESIKDIFHSQYLHYYNINGRSIIHAVEQFVLWLSPDKQLFNILNAIVWSMLLYSIVIFAIPRDKRTWIYWLLAIVYLRFLSPECSYLPFWASGSFNYYWMMLAAVVFLSIYRNSNQHHSPYLYPLYFIFAVLIGWSHETLITGIIVATLVEYIIQKQYKSPQHTILLLGLIVGYSIMFFAPGNFVKLEAITQGKGTSFIILALATAMQCKMIITLLLLLCYGYIKQRENTLEFINNNRFLIIASVVNMLFCMIIGVGGRAIFFTETLAFIIIIRFLSTFVREFNTASFGWMMPAFILLIAYEVCYASNWKKIYDPINKAIEAYTQQDINTDYIISDIKHPSPITSSAILSSHDFWSKQYDFGTFSAIYDRTFRILPTQAYQLITEEKLFSPENRLTSGLGFYTLDTINYLIMPCDTLPQEGQYIFNLHTPSTLDPDISWGGKLRRWIAPGSYPLTYTATNYSANPATPFTINCKQYIILHKPPYRRVKSVDFVPKQ